MKYLVEDCENPSIPVNTLADAASRARAVFSDYPCVVKAVLFGSFSRGEQTDASDVDFFLGLDSTCASSDYLSLLDYFDVDESLWQHSPYIRDSFLISVSQIGELVSKISPETCRRYFPDIEWQQIRGMRNIIVHVYANVDYDIVWDVVNEEAPKLKQTLLKNDDIRREYESTLVVEEDIEEDILGYFGALDPIVGDGADGRIPQDGNRP